MDNAVVALGAVMLFLAGILFAGRGRVAAEDAPIPWRELRARLVEWDKRLVAQEEQTRVLQALVTRLEDVSRGLGTLAARVENLNGVVSTIANERLAERAARDAVRDRAGDTINLATGPLQQQGGATFAGPTTVQGGVAGRDIGTIAPPRPTERPHSV